MADIVKFKSGNKSNIATTTTAIEKGTVYFAIEDDENGSIYFDKDGTHRILMGEKHSATADIAISDSLGQDITETYITDIDFDGTTNTAKVTATLTHGDGSTFTRDLPNAGAATAGIINTGAQTIAGNKTFTGALSSSGGATFSNSSFNYSGIESANGNAARVVWFSDSTTVGKPVYDNDLTYNPSTNTLKTTNFDGLAARATADSNGANIADTYISEIVSTPSSHKLTYTTGSGQDTDISTPYVLLAGDTMTGTLQFDDVNGIKVNSHNKDLKIWEVVGNSGSWNSEFGFHELYKGTGSGNDNTLEMYAHNQTGTHVKIRTIKQDGTITWHEAQNLDKTLTFNAINGIQYKGSKATHSMIRFKDNTADTGGNGLLLGGGGLTVLGSGESANATADLYTGGTETLVLASDNGIDIYTNFQDGNGSANARTYKWISGKLEADQAFTVSSKSTMYVGCGNGCSLIFQKNGSEVGRWNTSGNLMVGLQSDQNANTTYKLFVTGSANITSNLNVGGKIDTTWLRVINNSSDNTDDAMVYFENKSSADWAQKINLDTYNYGLYIIGTGTHLLRVGSTPDLWVGAGKVGIKTAAPGYELDVNGNERIQGCLHIYPTIGSYREGIRIHAYSNWSQVSLLGTDSSGDSGTTNNSWFVGNNNGNFYITRAGSTSSAGDAYRSEFSSVNNQWRLRSYVQAHASGIYRSGLHIYGPTYGNTAANMVSQTNDGDFRWNDGGPQITFDTNATPGGSQAGALIFTDHDNAGTGVSFHFVTNQNSNNKGGDLTVTAPRFRARVNLTVGQNTDNKTYNFYVNGTSYFNGAITVNANATFINEHFINFKQERKKADGGGWAYSPIRFIGNDNAMFANIGAFGDSNTFNYIFIGSNSYNGDNVRISSTSAITAYDNLNIGKYTANTAQSKEYQIRLNGGAGYLYMYSQAAVTGNRGIYGANAAGTGGGILTVNQNNAMTNLAPAAFTWNAYSKGGANLGSSEATAWGTIYTTNWFRSYGDTGWYSQTHGGGWYMTDDYHVRCYSNKGVWIPGGEDTSGTASPETKRIHLILGGLTGQHIEIDDNEIISKSNATTPSTLFLQDTTGYVQVSGSGLGVGGSNSSYKLYVNGNSLYNGIIYLANGTTYYINNSAVARLNYVECYNSLAMNINPSASVWPYIRISSRAGTSALGTGTTTYTTIAQDTWANLYYQIPGKRLTYATAGNASSATTTYYYPAKWFFRQYSPTSTGARTAYYEDYSLPNTDVGRTGNAVYQILTTKDYSAPDGRYVKKAGDTMTGNLTIQPASGVSWTKWINKTTQVSIEMWSDTTNAGIYSRGYWTGSAYTASAGWIIYRGTDSYVHTSFRLYGAVWNDYAEYRVANTKIPGKCVVEKGDDTLELSTKRLQPGCEIVSDTFGFAIGQTEKANTPIATTGRVLAYPYESREEFKKHIGEPVCSGPNGTVSIMTEEEWKQYPHCIIGTISSVPDYDTWGTENVKVNNRVWIRIR